MDSVRKKIRKSLTDAKKMAQKKRPFLAVRLLLVSYDELMEIRHDIVDRECTGSKMEDHWYYLYYLTKKISDEVIEEIQNEKIAKCVTELLLDEISVFESMRLNGVTENTRDKYPEISEQSELYFELLIKISPLAESYEQIQQLLNKPVLLSSKEKERFMKELLPEQGTHV